MCGLFGGYSSFLSKKEVELIENLGVVSQFRGSHSAGVVVSSKKYGTKSRVIRTRKCLGTTSHLFADNSYKEIIDGCDVQFVLGHARFATSGSITTANAHPFKCDVIYGVHNGTIDNFKVPKGEEESNSDSRILFNKINELGVDRALSEVGNGAYAIAYYNLNDDTINFARNDKRSLYYTDVAGSMYWASEQNFLRFVLERNNNYYNGNNIRPFLPGRLYSLKVGRHPSAMTSRELITNFDKKEEKEVVVVTEGQHTIFLKDQRTKESGDLSTRGVDLSSNPASKNANVVPFKPITLKNGSVVTKQDKNKLKNGTLFYRGYNRKLMPLSEVTNFLSKGCVFTGMRATVRDKVYWISPTEYMLKSFFDINRSMCDLFSKNGDGTYDMFESELFTRKQDGEKEGVVCH